MQELRQGLNITNVTDLSNPNDMSVVTASAADKCSLNSKGARKNLKSRQSTKVKSPSIKQKSRQSINGLKNVNESSPSKQKFIPILNYPNIINNNISGLHINYSNHIVQVPESNNENLNLKKSVDPAYRRCRS